MARDAGFRNADVDALYLYDPTVSAPGAERPGEWCGYAMAYMAVVLGSWRLGRRMRVTDALLPGMPADAPDVLVEYGLIGPDGMIPAATWDAWYGPAERRREQLRDRVARHRNGGSLADIVKGMPGARR